MNPTVSVVIPTYNRASLLPRALDSVCTQTFTDWEIILVDDGSTDSTSALFDAYRDRFGDRFVHFRQENAGPGAARNRGIDAARGRFVAFLDSDDEFLPTKLARQLELFERRPELGFVYSNYSCSDPAGRGYASAWDEKYPLAREVPHETIAPGLCVCRASLFETLWRGYFVATITGMVRRDVLGDHIRFDPVLRYSEEWLFYLQMARAGQSGYVDEPLSVHHSVPGSLARTDPRRNAVGYAQLLATIARSFPNVSRKQRRSLCFRLADAHRQIGYDALRDGDCGTALRSFTTALRHRFNPRTVGELLRSVGYLASEIARLPPSNRVAQSGTPGRASGEIPTEPYRTFAPEPRPPALRTGESITVVITEA